MSEAENRFFLGAEVSESTSSTSGIVPFSRRVGPVTVCSSGVSSMAPSNDSANVESVPKERSLDFVESLGRLERELEFDILDIRLCGLELP